jgi:hypothetical protein
MVIQAAYDYKKAEGNNAAIGSAQVRSELLLGRSSFLYTLFLTQIPRLVVPRNVFAKGVAKTSHRCQSPPRIFSQILLWKFICETITQHCGKSSDLTKVPGRHMDFQEVHPGLRTSPLD